MASKAAHASSIQIPGASTAFTAEACTVTTGTTYQLNTASKRVLDPATALVVKDGGVADTATAADFLFGKATLTEAPGGAVTMDGSYLPLLTLALVKEFSLKVSTTILDTTTFDSSGVKTRKAGLQTVELSLTTLEQRHTDLDAGAGVVTIDGAAVALYATPVLVSIWPGGVNDYFRGWFYLESLESKGSVDGLIELSMTLTGHVRTGSVGTGSTAAPVSFGWGP